MPEVETNVGQLPFFQTRVSQVSAKSTSVDSGEQKAIYIYMYMCILKAIYIYVYVYVQYIFNFMNAKYTYIAYA